MEVFASEDAIVNKLESFTKATKWASKHPEYGGIDDVLKMLREQLPSHTEQKTQLSETIQRIENYLAIEKKIREVEFLIKGLKDKDSEENKITSQIVKQAAIQMPHVKPKVIEENLIKNLTDSLDELKTTFDSARLETIEYVEKAKQISPTQEYYAPRDADDSIDKDYERYEKRAMRSFLKTQKTKKRIAELSEQGLSNDEISKTITQEHKERARANYERKESKLKDSLFKNFPK